MLVVVARMWRAYRKEYERDPILTLFLTILIASFIVFLVAAILSNGETAYRAMYKDHNDTFMDYFNSVMYSSDRPYGVWHVAYPPLITSFYSVIGHFTIPFIDVALSGRALSFALRGSQMGMMSFVIVTLVTFYVLYLIVSKVMKEKGVRKELVFLFSVVLAYPFIFAVERGNSIILALIFSLLFLFGYRSENKFIRYASYIALGVAVGIKVYPVMLILLVLRDRRYAEAAACTLIVMAILLVPFIFTDGAPSMLMNTLLRRTGNVDTYGFTSLNRLIFLLARDVLGISVGTVSLISNVIVGIFTLLSFAVILFDKEMKFWKVATLISCNLILGFGGGSVYLTIYMLPGILFFLSTETKMTRGNLFYAVCFAMTMILIPAIMPASVKHPAPVIGSFEALFVIIIAVALLYEGIGRIYRTYRDRRRGDLTPSPDAGAAVLRDRSG